MHFTTSTQSVSQTLKGFRFYRDRECPALNRLFIDIYGLSLQEGEVTEESMHNLLLRLLQETPNHPVPEFRYPIEPAFWGFNSGPVYGVVTTRQNIQNLYDNLQEKIWLAGS